MSGTSAFGKWKEKLKAGRVAEIVVAVILCVIVIAVVYSLLAGDDEKQTAAAETYAQQVERELADVLSQLEGAGNVSVFVSVANEGETVIAMETTVASDGTTTTSPVLVGGDVVVLEERKPAIAGVLIVAVPNCSSFDARKYGPYWAAYDVPRHLWHFTPSTIQQFGTKHGFILAERYPMPFDAFYVSMLTERYLHHRLPFVRGLWTGTLAWLSALAGKERSSSMIYVFRKKKG